MEDNATKLLGNRQWAISPCPIQGESRVQATKHRAQDRGEALDRMPVHYRAHGQQHPATWTTRSFTVGGLTETLTNTGSSCNDGQLCTHPRRIWAKIEATSLYMCDTEVWSTKPPLRLGHPAGICSRIIFNHEKQNNPDLHPSSEQGLGLMRNFLYSQPQRKQMVSEM